MVSRIYNVGTCYRSLVQTVAPTVEPIDFVEAQQQIRVRHDQDNAFISKKIQAAREYAEKYTERQLVTATWTMKLDDFPSDAIEIPRPPLQSVTSITYVDNNGVTQTVDAATIYTVDTSVDPGRLYLRYGQIWPASVRSIESAVTITYIAGYASVSAIPQEIKDAMLLYVHHVYFNRDGTALPPAIDALLDHWAVTQEVR